MTQTPADALSQAHPLEFTIQYPPSRHYFAPWKIEASQGTLNGLPAKALLYVHVPFCEAKCFYCNFAVDLRNSKDTRGRYVEAVVSQLARLDALWPKGCEVAGIDIGGGTPTLLEATQLERLLGALRPWRARASGAHPLSIETTPKVAATSPERLAALREGGVARVSMGLQSTNDETLAAVNRRAQRSLGDAGVEALRAAGFRRVNVDLVFGLPGQTRAHWLEDLKRVAALPVDSVTTYDCLYRGEGRAMPRLTALRPSPQDYGALYDQGYEWLTTHGFYARYGSLNFSRFAEETGTSPYFEGRLLDGLPYIGAGNYASSMVGERWWFAPFGVDPFTQAIEAGQTLPIQDLYGLPLEERCAKYVLLSLSFGLLDSARFARFAGCGLEAMYGAALKVALGRRWLREEGAGVYGVGVGMFSQMPGLRALFYSPGALAWVAARTTRPDALQDQGSTPRAG